MKVSVFIILVLLSPSAWALNPTKVVDAVERPFMIVENNNDHNFFVTPLTILDPRITGANRWTGLKGDRQQSLGYIDNGLNTIANNGWNVDIWLDDFTVDQPLTGLRCISWYAGCNAETSLLEPQATDSAGFYGVNVPAGGLKWMHGMMSDAFYFWLIQLGTGERFSMLMNSCKTPDNYDATKGERCRDQRRGNWYQRRVKHRKMAHLLLTNTNAFTEVFISSNGVPIINEGNGECKAQVIGRLSGIMCKMMNYHLDVASGQSNVSVRIFPVITHAGLDAKINNTDVQFSLDGNRWRNKNQTYNFRDLQSSEYVYMFFSSGFFKALVNLGLSNSDTRDLINFRFQNTISPESGWYEFSTSNRLLIKPRDFGVSIVSDDMQMHPHRQGLVSRKAQPLSFGYIVTTSGRTAADDVDVRVTGPAYSQNGRSLCLFRSADQKIRVPFPAQLFLTTTTGEQQKLSAGCDGIWHSINHAQWQSRPWEDTSGDRGILNSTHLRFEIPMNAPESQVTVEGEEWFGEVSAKGNIEVRATWRNVK